MRFLIVLAGVALMACAPATTSTTTTSTTTTTSAASGPGMGGIAPLAVAGLAVNCNAEQESVCDEHGCRAQSDGMVHAALTYDGATGHGELCMGEGCDAIFLAPMPAASPLTPADDVFGAIVIPGAADNSNDPPLFQGTALLKRDGSSFVLTRGGSGVWTGACGPLLPHEN